MVVYKRFKSYEQFSCRKHETILDDIGISVRNIVQTLQPGTRCNFGSFETRPTHGT